MKRSLVSGVWNVVTWLLECSEGFLCEVQSRRLTRTPCLCAESGCCVVLRCGRLRGFEEETRSLQQEKPLGSCAITSWLPAGVAHPTSLPLPPLTARPPTSPSPPTLACRHTPKATQTKTASPASTLSPTKTCKNDQAARVALFSALVTPRFRRNPTHFIANMPATSTHHQNLRPFFEGWRDAGDARDEGMESHHAGDSGILGMLVKLARMQGMLAVMPATVGGDLSIYGVV